MRSMSVSSTTSSTNSNVTITSNDETIKKLNQQEESDLMEQVFNKKSQVCFSYILNFESH